MSQQEVIPQFLELILNLCKGSAYFTLLDESQIELYFFPKLLDGREAEKLRQLRYTLYKESWQKIEVLFQQILTQFNQETLNNITSFIDKSTCPNRYKDYFLEIPFAVVSLGTEVGSMEGERFFSNLAQTLTSSSGRHRIISLDGRKYTNVKAVLTDINYQLYSINAAAVPQREESVVEEEDAKNQDDVVINEDAMNGESNDEDLMMPSTNSGLSAASYDPLLIEYWFTSMQSDDKPRSLVLLMENIECLRSSFDLEQFLATIFELISSGVPIVLVVGLGTTWSFFRQRLKSQTLELLNITNFVFEKKDLIIDALIERLLIDEAIVCLNENTYRVLLDGYILHDLSLSQLKLKLKYVLMSNYQNNPWSILSHRSKKVAHNFGLLSSEHVEYLAKLDSFKVQPPNVPASKLAVHISNSFEKYQEMYKLGYYFLKRFQDLIPNYKRKPPHILHLYGLKGLSVSSKEPLYTLLEHIKHGGYEQVKMIIQLLDDFSWKFMQNDWTDRVQVFKSRIDQWNRHEDPMEIVVLTSKASELIECFLTTHLKSYTTLMAHEVIFIGDQYDEILKIFSPDISSSIHRALNTPQYYLNCDCFELDEDDVPVLSPTLPDICIAYRLLMESGRSVNVDDWRSAFCAILGEGSNAQKDTFKSRFELVIQELEWLGFLRPSNKRKNLVYRLVWPPPTKNL